MVCFSTELLTEENIPEWFGSVRLMIYLFSYDVFIKHRKSFKTSELVNHSALAVGIHAAI